MRDHPVPFLCLTIPAAVFLGLAGLAAAAPQQTGESEVTLILDKGQRPRLRLAYPAPGGGALGGEVGAAAREADGTLRQDLEASGVFVLQGPQELSVLTLTGVAATDYELYRSLGNELLLDVQFKQEDSRLVLEGRVFTLDGGRFVLGKRYRGTASSARRIAHTFADEMVRYFTGRPGVSLTSICFYSDRDGRDRREIYMMDYDGWNQRALTNHQTLSMSPEFSPRGDLIAYVTYVTGAPGIWLADVRTAVKTPVVTDGTLNISPSFSPDGRRLAFARSVGDGNSEIFVCNRDGSDLRRLTNASGIDTNPAWSPTGREIAFTSSRSGSPQIYVMGSEGTDLRRVSFQGDYNDGAAWSPDGTRIAHATRRDGTFDIALSDVVTMESRVVTKAPGSHEAPTFSPDGRKIAFASTRSGSSGTATQIWVLDLAGGEERRLTTEGNNLAPSWSAHPE